VGIVDENQIGDDPVERLVGIEPARSSSRGLTTVSASLDEFVKKRRLSGAPRTENHRKERGI